MFRAFVVAFAAVVFTLPAQAQTFNDAQRAEIEKLVKSYILENPEIIPEAMYELQRRQEAKMIADAGPQLYNENGAVLIGPENASVTVVEFFDYRCGYCKIGFDVLKQLLAADNDVNILFRQFPIRDREGETLSYDAARAALAADKQDKFFEMHQALYNSPSRLTRDRVESIAERLGMNLAQLRKDMNKPALQTAISINYDLARSLRLEGTPAYVVGDKIHRGALSLDQMKEAVASARETKAGR